MRLRAFAACLLVATLTGQTSAPPSPEESGPAAEALRLNSLGAGLMGMQDFERAKQHFQQAYRLDPTFYAARLNEGIAWLNQQKYPEAKQILQEAAQREPANPRAWYALGLLQKAEADLAEALQAFRKATEADPHDADSWYSIGQILLDQKDYKRAMDTLERALKLDERHVSAMFALARAHQRTGNTQKARELADRFQELTRTGAGTPLGIGYGQQGRYALVFAPPSSALRPGDFSGVRFIDVSAQVFGPRKLPASATEQGSLCFWDQNGDGFIDIVKTTPHGTQLLRNQRGRRFVAAAPGSTTRMPAAVGCAIGDFDNDGFDDLLLRASRALHLLPGGRSKIKSAKTQRIDEAARAVLVADTDHEGDLDIVTVSNAGLRTWQNTGTGTFQAMPLNVTPASSLEASLMLTDFNNDGFMDIIASDRSGLPVLLANRREGRFEKIDLGISLPVRRLVSFDLNRDGWMDLAALHATGPVSIWTSVNGETLRRVPGLPAGIQAGTALSVIDLDNDGWLDLAVGTGVAGDDWGLRLLRNRGSSFEDVTAMAGVEALKLNNVLALNASDYDHDGDNDLFVLTRAEGLRLLKNAGGNRNAWIALTLKGSADNRSAIGTTVEAFTTSGLHKFEISGAGASLGSSPLPVLAGLDGASQVERLRLHWPTGVVQEEVELIARKRRLVHEIDRRSSSCPVLFAWNGTRFEFISDVIGAGVIGHWVAPGEYNLPDPTEYVKISGDQLRPENGQLKLRFMEPMEEVNYFDEARLLVIDYPADVEVYPNERFVTASPMPDGKPVFSRNARPPSGAWDGEGRNVLPRLLRRDRQYVKGFRLEKFYGFAGKHTLELEIEPADPKRPLRLLMHGFTEYFTANSMYSASQAGVTVIAPYVEAQDVHGQWIRVTNDMGFPAGLPRMMVADLTGKVPKGTRRLRITTNLQIYWDQVLIDTTSDSVEATVTEIHPRSADLRFVGYPKQIEGRTRGDLTYDYTKVSATGPFAHPYGAYTRYGDVLPLVVKADDKFAIFGPGEEIAFEFDSTLLPAIRPGWKRDYFFYGDGFVKDMDFYGAHARTVEPLPFHGMKGYPYSALERYPTGDAHLRYRLEFNDRFVFSPDPRPYRFSYKAAR